MQVIWWKMDINDVIVRFEIDNFLFENCGHEKNENCEEGDIFALWAYPFRGLEILQTRNMVVK